jgi:TolB-like protein/Tfp pilus assembly protein PilF
MPPTGPHLPEPPDPEEIRHALRKILASRRFAEAERLRQMLDWLVGESIHGRSKQIKESLIAIEVFDRGPSWDSQSDALVRVQMRNLRQHLGRYFETEGKDDRLIVTIPKGSYAPRFAWKAPPPPPDPPKPRFRMRPIAAVLAIVIVAILSILAWHKRTSAPVRLAVLPFENVSGQSTLAHVAAGLTEELTSELARSPNSRVAASPPNGSTAARGIAASARQLGVRYLVSGSARPVGDRTDGSWSITARLADSETGTFIWSDHYVRDAALLASLPEEIAAAVALTLKLGPSPPPSSSAAAPPISSAHDAYLRGLYLRSQHDPESLEQARLAFQQAVDEAPSHVRARVALADAWLTIGFHDTARASSAFAEARRQAEQVRQLAPSMPENLALRARIAFLVDWNAPAAETLFRDSIRMAPSLSRTRQSYALLLMSRGRYDESANELMRARESDPLSLSTANDLGVALFAGRRYSDALAETRRVLRLAPRSRSAHFLAGCIHGVSGRPDQAIAEYRQALSGAKRPPEILGRLGFALAAAGQTGEARKVLQEMESGPLSHTHRAIVFLGLGERDQAISALEAAVDSRESEVLFLDADPHFDGLRGDKRFDALRRRVGLTP